MKIGLVGCGSKKKDEGEHKAKNLYTSHYFELKRKYAEQHCDNWLVVSAEHGLLYPGTWVEPYDTNIAEVNKDEWKKDVKAKIPDILDMWGINNVVDEEHVAVILAGQQYAELIEDILKGENIRVMNPFKHTSGIGEQISYLKENVETSQKTLSEVSK